MNKNLLNNLEKILIGLEKIFPKKKKKFTLITSGNMKIIDSIQVHRVLLLDRLR